MKEIGGYFELELEKKDEYHKNAISLNSARSCLKYIIIAQKIQKIYLPCLICNSVIEPVQSLNIEIEFYNIDEKFEIKKTFDMEPYSKILYVNYYGLKSKYINETLYPLFEKKLIIDNTQSFFEAPLKMIDTIYSPRKFFGVPDGGYLYTSKELSEEVDVDDNTDYIKHLIGRINSSATSYYQIFIESERRLSIVDDIKKMAPFTKVLLGSINYETTKNRRLCNFNVLHNKLKKYNILKKMDVQTPFVYPLVLNYDISNIKKELINHKIYIPTYWLEALNNKYISDEERKLIKNLVPLPCDQRYFDDEMLYILDVIMEYL